MGLTSRTYLVNDSGEIERLSRRVIDLMVQGEDALPQHAGKKIRALFVLLETDEGSPTRILQTQGSVFDFDHEGKIDQGLRDSLREVLNAPRHENAGDDKVVSLEAKRSGRPHRRNHWEPTKQVINQIVADIWGDVTGQKPDIKFAKSASIKPPPISYATREAYSDIHRLCVEIIQKIDRMNDRELKGLMHLLKTEDRTEKSVAELMAACSIHAQRSADIAARRKKGNGVWFVLIDKLTHDESESYGHIKTIAVLKCNSLKAAEEAARRMIVDHAREISRTVSIEARIITDIEYDLDGASSDIALD